MRIIKAIHFLLLAMLSFTGYCQTDTIKVDAPVSLILERKLTASGVKTGDTIAACMPLTNCAVTANGGVYAVIKRRSLNTGRKPKKLSDKISICSFGIETVAGRLQTSAAQSAF